MGNETHKFFFRTKTYLISKQAENEYDRIRDEHVASFMTRPPLESTGRRVPPPGPSQANSHSHLLRGLSTSASLQVRRRKKSVVTFVWVDGRFRCDGLSFLLPPLLLQHVVFMGERWNVMEKRITNFRGDSFVGFHSSIGEVCKT